MKKNIFIFVLILAVTLLFFMFTRSIYNGKDITNFEECVVAGNPVMESYPRQCNSKDGKHFVEDIGNELEKVDTIRIFTPRPNEEVSSPLIITGEARGTWFFEGSFPVVLTNWDGLIISEHYATAEGEWMTENFVPFTSTVEFKNPPYKEQGTLILKRDNPSNLPEYDDALEIPVIFKAKESAVPIEATFDSRIIYTLNQGLPKEAFVEHCALTGGTFNSCGSPCAPDAEVCATVCAYTCELPQ